jgi:hypothetical protein
MYYIWHLKQLWDVQCLNGRVLDIVLPIPKLTLRLRLTAGRFTMVQGNGGTLLPSWATFQFIANTVSIQALRSLCHAHIHLDNCFIMEQCDSLLTG